MNDSLLTYSGGQPLYADDLSFMQNSLSVMTNHLAKAFGDTYIVWGCLDEEKSNVIAGAVCIGGKLYEVPALGLLGENKLCYREVQSDEREFEDGQRHNVKKSYEAYLSTDTSGSVAYIDLKTVKTPFKELKDDVYNKVLPDWLTWEIIPVQSSILGYARYKSQYLGLQGYALAINIRFDKYDPSDRIFTSSLPINTGSIPVSIYNSESGYGMSANISIDGKLSNANGEPLTLPESSGSYSINDLIFKVL